MTIADKHRTVYYRPTEGDCSCQLFYDGQEDLLFNVDNRHLFYYAFLLQYLHNMVEGRNPLASYLRSCERTIATQSNTKPVKIKLLRQAWNAFARLLDIDWYESFQCPLCGPCPEVVICDGTMLGFRKDLLVAFANHPEPTSTISGSHHADRIFIRSLFARDLLLRFSGYTRDRKRLCNPQQLTATEIRRLIRLLEGEQLDVFAKMIDRLGKGSERLAPEPYRAFLSELSRSTPVCGMLQVCPLLEFR